MSDDDKNIAASGSPSAVTIGDQTYLATPLNDQSTGTLLAWVKDRLRSPLVDLREDPAYASMNQVEKEIAIKSALEIKNAGGSTPNGEAFRKHLMTPAGTAMLAWLMLLPKHPDVTLEALAPAITDANFLNVLADLGKAAGLELLAGKTTGRPTS